MSSWKDLLKIYGLVLGAFIVVFPVYIIVAMMIASPILGVVGICFAILPFILGAYILYYLLKKKVTPSPYYYMYQSYGYNPYQYSGYNYPGYGYAPATPQPYYQYQQPAYGYPYGYQGYAQPQYQYTTTQQMRSQIMPSDKDEQEEKLDLPTVKSLLAILLASIALGFISLAFGLIPLFIPFFIIGFSFPSLIWISYVYSKDIYEPEPARVVLIALTWGMLSTIPSLIFEAPFVFIPAWMMATFVAPVVEEAFKPMILPFLRIKIDNELDGIIYGVTCGMGFALMENLFYEMGAFVVPDLVSAAASWSMTTLLRGLGSTIIHAVGVGIVGYCYARFIMKKGSIAEIAGAYSFAVLLHLIWNGTLSGLELVGGSTAEMGTIVFICTWPIVEFVILKIFLDKATHVDELMFGPQGERPFGKPKPAAAATNPQVAQAAKGPTLGTGRPASENVPQAPRSPDAARPPERPPQPPYPQQVPYGYSPYSYYGQPGYGTYAPVPAPGYPAPPTPPTPPAQTTGRRAAPTDPADEVIVLDDD